jgi:hypothetical protein
MRALWEQLGATVDAIAPATLIDRDGKPGVRFPVISAQGDPSLTKPAHAAGTGTLDGGFVARSAFTELRVTQLDGVVRGEQMSGRCTINGVDAGMRSVFTWRVAEADISVVPGRAGKPTMLKVSNVPVRVTREALEAFQGFVRSADTRSISTDTVVAHVTAQGHYVPANS